MKMRLALLAHPDSLESESMPRFAGMILRGMAERGHEIKMWTSRQTLGRLPIPSSFIRKWLGYIDQFLIYPGELHKHVAQEPKETVFVVTDQALGMWVPQLAHRPHVIHCHDFLALRSACAEFPENRTHWTGRQYQRLIRRGFSRGRAFISVSKKTREDLHRFLPRAPTISEVVYNGLNYHFRPMDRLERSSLLKQTGIEILESGFVLHVGGNQWYKNRVGVIEIYRAYVGLNPKPPALWMIGATPTAELTSMAASVPSPGKVHFVTGLTNEQVNAAYSHARAMLFPSLEEGFGWPIVEAMAAECPVISTDLPPMTEIADRKTWLISRMPFNGVGRALWAKSAASTLDKLLHMGESDRTDMLRRGRQHAARFNTESALAAYEEIYSQVIHNFKH
jgi:glycosyltransferase involved in cell wall biosynthesis